jgi:CRP-like cAMP-binding protein
VLALKGAHVPLYHASNLLTIMAAGDRSRIEPFLVKVDLKVRQSLARPRRPIEHVYFIDEGMVSVVAKAKGDNQAEVAVIGSEGASGCAVLLEAGMSSQDLYMQVAGSGHRIEAGRLLAAMAQSPSLRCLMLQYVHTVMVQQDETAVSAARANIRQRLARWLLMAQDRLGSELRLTHDFLGVMLAVRRSGVTDAINDFATDGLIATRRACITVIDRDRLLEIAGGYYGSPGAEYRRLFEHGDAIRTIILARQ